MKVLLFFVCMMVSGASFAEPLLGLVCTEGDIKHVFQGDDNDHTIVYIDGEVYNFVKEHTVGDISFTQYSNDTDPNVLAFIQVNIQENTTGEQYAKLVMMRKAAKQATFGGLCKYED